MYDLRGQMSARNERITRGRPTLACLLNDLLGLFLGLKEGLDALRLAGLDAVRPNGPLRSGAERLPSSVSSSGGGEGVSHRVMGRSRAAPISGVSCAFPCRLPPTQAVCSVGQARAKKYSVLSISRWPLQSWTRFRPSPPHWRPNRIPTNKPTSSPPYANPSRPDPNPSPSYVRPSSRTCQARTTPS